MTEKGPKDETSTFQNMSIREFDITDEFTALQKTTPCVDLAKKLLEVPRGAIFLIDENGIPVGAVTAREFLIATAKGVEVLDKTAEDLMNTNIMEIGVDDNVSEVLLMISKYAPYAVVVKDNEGNFVGYFSPKDYHEALQKTGVL
ncbi:MAG: CBS domain-containing protein [Candidatus Thermoplasmatota archaeon]|nr:CBS domain-containing protein [Candidatus Thermoplasmatota archaeon]